ncbi:MAG: hypothetical protein ACRD2B_01945 [Terriglobia bacterium]
MVSESFSQKEERWLPDAVSAIEAILSSAATLSQATALGDLLHGGLPLSEIRHSSYDNN